ncbi:hypothetical protein D3C87_1520950 [compost metagenome]
MARVLQRQDFSQHDGVDAFHPGQGDGGRFIQGAGLGTQSHAVARQKEAEDLTLAVGQDALAAGPAAQDQARRHCPSLGGEGGSGGDDFLKDA